MEITPTATHKGEDTLRVYSVVLSHRSYEKSVIYWK